MMKKMVILLVVIASMVTGCANETNKVEKSGMTQDIVMNTIEVKGIQMNTIE